MFKKGDGVKWFLTIVCWMSAVAFAVIHVQQFRSELSISIAGVPQASAANRTLNINRFYSDIDGREIASPRIRLSGGTDIVGSVIVRQLRDNTWQVKIKPDDAKKSEMTVIVDVVTESATYFDLGPSPDNPGAIRS